MHKKVSAVKKASFSFLHVLQEKYTIFSSLNCNGPHL